MAQLFPPSRVIGVEDPDEELVERALDGDRKAFSALVERYQRPIYNAAYRVLGREEDAKDVVQTVFMKVAEHLGEYDERRKFFSWVYRIAVNESLNYLRTLDREEPLADEDAEPGAESTNPEWRANEAEISARIQRALMGLKASDRVVLTLRHFSDCSYQEIATILDVEVKTVKSRLHEARARLRERLEDLRPV